MASRKRSELARWDRGVLKQMREILPEATDAERSRQLFRTSLFGAEGYLRNLDKRISGKKGSVLDLFYISGVIFFFAVILLFGAKISGSFNTSVQSLSDLSVSEKGVISGLNDNYSGSLDNSMMFLVFGLSFVTLVLAALVRIHPVFIPFFIVALVFLIVFAAVLSNIYETAASNDLLSADADRLSKTGLVLSVLPWIIGVVGVILMVVQYKTWSFEQ